MSKILITNTESLSGWEIETYLKPIFSNVVIGAGFLSDFSASITDIFGGRSSSYEKKLQSVNDNALQVLKSRASEIGANCVIGLRVNINQITGKNVQMFMVSAYGTAVIAKNITPTKTATTSLKEIDKSTVVDTALLIKLLDNFQKDGFKLTMEYLQLIIDSKSEEFAPLILKKLKQVSINSFADETQIQAKKLFIEYFSVISLQRSMAVLYEALIQETDERLIKDILSIIEAQDMVDFEGCIKMLSSDDLSKKKLALAILKFNKPVYIYEDIDELKRVAAKVETSFPLLSSVTTKKGFLSTNEKEVWLCKCGKSNEIDTHYCYNCQNSQYGFKADEIYPRLIIDELNNKAKALTEIFQSK